VRYDKLKTFLYSDAFALFEKRMKKTVIAIVAVVLLVAVVVTATHRWGYTNYGSFYYHDYPFYGYPQTEQPVGVYVPAQEPTVVYPGSFAPQYSYPTPLSSEYLYRYGMSYVPRSSEGQLCGLMNGVAYGCEFGLECEYTISRVRGAGVCVRPRGLYPTPEISYPYYFG